jgi:hypothetical protein
MAIYKSAFTQNLPANLIWQKWADQNIDEARYVIHKNIANEAKRGTYRDRFETFLMQNGCYLEVKNGLPEIKGYDEESLVMFLLKWS